MSIEIPEQTLRVELTPEFCFDQAATVLLEMTYTEGTHGVNCTDLAYSWRCLGEAVAELTHMRIAIPKPPTEDWRDRDAKLWPKTNDPSV